MWDYSVAVDVRGFIVEAVTGKSLSAFLEERIWKPLDMADTAASPCRRPRRHATRLPSANDPVSGQAAEHSPRLRQAASSSTAAAVARCRLRIDYLRFAQMLVNSGTLDGKRLLSRKTIETHGERSARARGEGAYHQRHPQRRL